MIIQLYRKWVSPELRENIYHAFLGDFLWFMRNWKENSKNIGIFLFQGFLPQTTENKLRAFMGRYGLTPFPYPFMLKYRKLSFDFLWDNELQMHYLLHAGKKLYFAPGLNKYMLNISYRYILIEQDPISPHKYFTSQERLRGKTLLDIGAAEGIVALEAIDMVDHVYLFECDENWIKALHATFAPWKEKVTIISKYVSGIDDEYNITIDSFLKDKSKDNLFLKMDIEGAEQAALWGAADLLKTAKDLDYSICTYHRAEDSVEINKILSGYGFESEYTDGYLYFENEFRKAVLFRKQTN